MAAGRALKNFCGFGKLRNAAYGRCTAYGCGLVCRNVGKGGAQDVLVVKGNGRIAHEVGGDGCCGVVFAAKASFKHCQLHALAGKTQQGQHRKKLKVGQIGRGSHDLVGWLNPVIRRPGGAGGIIWPANADALCGADKVRRGVEAHPTAVSKGKGSQK